MMEGSSLRMMVGMYSALGTLEEMSWGQHMELLREGPAASEPRGSRSPCEANPPLPPWRPFLRSPKGSPVRNYPHPPGQPPVASSIPDTQSQVPSTKGPPCPDRLEKPRGQSSP